MISAGSRKPPRNATPSPTSKVCLVSGRFVENKMEIVESKQLMYRRCNTHKATIALQIFNFLKQRAFSQRLLNGGIKERFPSA